MKNCAALRAVTYSALGLSALDPQAGQSGGTSLLRRLRQLEGRAVRVT
jgi:hypothetical protein